MKRGLAAILFSSLLAAAPPPSAPPAVKAAPRKPAPSTAVSDAAFEKLAQQAKTARELGKLDEATKLLEQCLRMRPKWDEGYWLIGTILYEQDHYAEAREAMKRVVVLAPKMAPAWAMLGLCEFETKEYEAAAAHLDRARMLGLTFDDQLGQVARYHLILLLNKYEKFEVALELLVGAARKDQVSPAVIEAAGLAALRRPILPTELDPKDRELIYLAGQAVMSAGARKGPEAQKLMKEMVEKYPSTKNVHYVYGSFLLFGEPDAGIAELDQELKLQPNHVPSLLQLANEYLKRDETAKALDCSERAVKAEPNNFVAHSFLGRSLAQMGDHAKAIVELEKARDLAPDSPQVQILLASSYSKLGRKDDAGKARAEFQRLKGLSKSGGEQQ